MNLKLIALAALFSFISPYALAQTPSKKESEPTSTQVVSVPVVQHHEEEHKLTGQNILGLIAESKDYLPFDIDVPGESFVSTGPYVGVPIQFAGSNLVINSPSVNTDVQLLTIRKKIHAQLMAMGGTLFKEPYHSHLLLSGIVEGQMGLIHYRGGANQSYIDITNMSIDFFFIGPSDWSLGFIELMYDNATPLESVYGSTLNSQYTVFSSRVFVNKAFITIGDFSRSPFYGTLGQYYVPFGTYSSALVSDTAPKIVARTKARALEFGFYEQKENAWFGSIYIFKGAAQPGPPDQINNGGLNLGYTFTCGKFSGTIGGGIIANVADSAGMQLGAGFQSYEIMSHRVPFYNVNANLAFGSHIDFIFEFVGPTTRFNREDLSFYNHGAKPWALDAQITYSFLLGTHPSSIGVAYDQTSQALALSLPRKSYFLVFNTSIWRNTLQSIEFRHDEPYSKHAFANGPIGAADVPIIKVTNTDGCFAAACTSNGKPDNMLTAQFDYYF